ncbi:MAG: 2-phosphosulfolactate phosphatase [Tannerellaceae bacterium]|jgi:2-phosphosulfolactate phosphatase|nr:2-phosphosulfolactate phosphatase [Tannerellaceae bacterium]
MEIDVCFSPALYPFYHHPESIVVVVDVFRATTTMVTAFHEGVRSIRPVATVEEAEAYKEKGWLVGAERNVKRCDFADFGNSPFDYTAQKLKNKDLVFTTTNGTKAITLAKDAFRVVTGAFINLHTVAMYCIEHRKNVVVLASGWENKINIEDTLFGGALTDLLLCAGGYRPAGDAARIAQDMWNEHKSNLTAYIRQTEHFHRLETNRLADAVPYCLTLNCVSALPVLHIENGTLVLLDHAKYTNKNDRYEQT